MLTWDTCWEYEQRNQEQDSPGYFCHCLCPGGVTTFWHAGKDTDDGNYVQPEDLAEVAISALRQPELDSAGIRKVLAIPQPAPVQ